MSRQKRRKMPRHTDWTHARPSAAMRNAECLVQVQVAYVRPDITGTTETDLGIHIRTVHIDLAPLRMDDLADPTHAHFENAMSRGVGDHQCGQSITMLDSLGFEIAQIHVALLVASHRH